MPLSAGMRLGPYEIQFAIGAGAMGEVYRARDTRLGRDVAVKALPAALASDRERLRRFEQEARAAAALNHPNILAVYDIGRHEDRPFIVSELLDGETLRERLAVASGGDASDGASLRMSALPARKAIDYAAQIARGLAAAHEKGIVHRDLKPGNVFVTADGRVKILDFGIAKLTQSEPTPTDPSELPTTAFGHRPAPTGAHGRPDTVPGMVLGTLGYMSPEQVRGQIADHRSDIFALGATLYEMLSGRRAFLGETTADTMTAILKEDPPGIAVDLHVPPALTRIVDRCLEKDPAARFQSAGDLAFALEGISSHPGSPDTVAALAPLGPGRWVAWVTAGLAVVAALALGAVLYLGRAPADARVYRSTISPPPDTTIPSTAGGGGIGVQAVSPDGRRLAFAAVGPDGRRLLWIRLLDSASAQPLAGTEGGSVPFWSPDSRVVAFMAGGQLRKIDVDSGSSLTVCDAPGGLDGSWSRDDVILFAATISDRRVLWRVPAAGGTPAPATTLDVAAGDNRHTAPFFLPDGRHYLYLVIGSKAKGPNDPRAVYVGSLDTTGPGTLLFEGGSNVKYANGHLLFLRGQTLMAQPFDPARLHLTGEPAPLAEQVDTRGASGAIGAYSVSEAGVLAYVTYSGDRSRLVWFDRAGKQTGVLGDEADYGDVELSPSGGHVAVSILDPVRRTRDIWVYDVARGLPARFTFDPGEEVAAIWSPDGSRVAFSARRKESFDVFAKTASGAGSDDALLVDASHDDYPLSWSPDGRFILLAASVVGGGLGSSTDLLVLPTEADGTPLPVVQTPFNEGPGRVSPDGRWVAYQSNESGRSEVYVSSFPKPGGKWQISLAGGSFPRWRKDGKEIVYLAPDNRLMAAAVNGTGSAFEVGATLPLFQTRLGGPASSYRYDVAPDGQTFLVSTLAEAPSTSISLLVNWTAALNK